MTRFNLPEQTEYGSAEEYFGIIRRIVLKRWWLIVLCVAAATVAGLAGSMLVEPVYRATTTIRVRQNVLTPVARRGRALAGQSSLETEALWLKNRSLLEEVMDKTGIAATVKSRKGRIALMEKLRDSIKVVVYSDSLQVTADWNDPEVAAQIVNTLADSFIERYGAINRAEARELRLLLEQQVGFVHLKVDEAQRKLSEFVRKHGDIAVSQRGLAANEQFTRVETELAENNIAVANAMKRLELIKKRMGKDGETLSELELGVTPEQIVSNSSIQTRRAQIARLEERIAALSSLYKDEYPELRNAQAQLKDAKRALAEELLKLIPDSSLSIDDAGEIDLLAEFIQVRSEIENLRSQQSELRSLATKFEERARELPDKEAQYFSLLRNRTISEDLYNTLLMQLTEANIAEQTDTWDVRVLERAYAPYSRLRPKPVKNAAFGAIIGMLIGIAVCMLLEYFDDSFKTAEEIERYLQLPVLAVLPKFDLPAVSYRPAKRH